MKSGEKCRASAEARPVQAGNLTQELAGNAFLYRGSYVWLFSRAARAFFGIRKRAVAKGIAAALSRRASRAIPAPRGILPIISKSIKKAEVCPSRGASQSIYSARKIMAHVALAPIMPAPP